MSLNLVIASRNPGKLKELVEIADQCKEDQSFEWLKLELAPDGFDPEETGHTYVENAIIKARAAAQLTGRLAVADDSGLEVEALDGRPGVHSARYCAGSDQDRRKKLLGELQDIPVSERQARFVCAMAVCSESKVLFDTLATWSGRIGSVERGQGGFGYDPVFCLASRDVTAAQLSSKEKNLISHRGQAWRMVLRYLEKNFMPQ